MGDRWEGKLGEVDDRVRNLMREREEMQGVIKNLEDLKREMEGEARELKQKISQQAHELDLTREEIKELRATNKGLDSTKFTQ